MFEIEPDTCPKCSLKHLPTDLHNALSPVYVYQFFDKYGRVPTWNDAMSHCTPELRVRLRRVLTDEDIDITSGIKLSELDDAIAEAREKVPNKRKIIGVTVTMKCLDVMISDWRRI